MEEGNHSSSTPEENVSSTDDDSGPSVTVPLLQKASAYGRVGGTADAGQGRGRWRRRVRRYHHGMRVDPKMTGRKGPRHRL
ncbi:hypothetical protein HPP92_000563 [Vanilla planifolia]|uniref:Uncharacterized protein n=1 Tax=Vanilla planifolia TaxID=51239 RepID=A0A835S2E8_VANPL|nr:hypothetical protein HPP92_000563 [Vanilla planifolia]